LIDREGFPWKTLLAALVIIVLGVLIMLWGTNMLFEMNPISIFAMVVAVILIFSGIVFWSSLLQLQHPFRF
jgi:undecaprenyl pyrophosphate phosphatase UppP